MTDWQSLEDLLSDWSRQACVNRTRSARSARRYKKLHYILGIPVVILSSSAGSAALSQIGEKVGNDKVRLVAGSLGLVAAILAALQTFFRFGETAEKYRAVGIGYERVETRIEEILALPENLRGKVPDLIDDLRTELNALSDASPDIPSHTHPANEA